MHEPIISDDDHGRLVAGSFDETLSPAEEARLDRLVAGNPEVALEVARAALVLDRLVAATTVAADREYVVRVLDHGPDGPSPTVMSGGRGRKPGIDGTRLFLRGDDRFLLVRRFGDGSEFLTGSDGAMGWAVPPKGPVHLSRDVRRFRRGMPGEREELPFVDLRAGLEELRLGYRLALTADGEAPVLRAERQRRRGRGPETVTVWFDDDGIATRIEMAGLAAEDGQPRAVALELVSREDRGPDFFGHAAHHAADRTLEWE